MIALLLSLVNVIWTPVSVDCWLNKMNDPIVPRLCFWYRETVFAKSLLIIIVPFFRFMSSHPRNTASPGETPRINRNTP